MNQLWKTHRRSSQHRECLLNSVVTSNQNRDMRRQALHTPISLYRGRQVAHIPSRLEKASCKWMRNFLLARRGTLEADCDTNKVRDIEEMEIG
jgi:hypothetical protein